MALQGCGSYCVTVLPRSEVIAAAKYVARLSAIFHTVELRSQLSQCKRFDYIHSVLGFSLGSEAYGLEPNP